MASQKLRGQSIMPSDNGASEYYEKALELAQEPHNDFAKAYSFLTKAHEAGSGEAAYAIGNWYFYGRYLSKDINKAVEFWNVAADRDSIDGATELAKYYENEEFTKPNMSKALGYYMKAALLGDAQSMFEVGRIYYHGIGIKKDKFLADVWYDAAEDNGYSESETEEE